MKVDFTVKQLRVLKETLAPLPGGSGQFQIYETICSALESVDVVIKARQNDIVVLERRIVELKAEIKELS